MTEASDLGYAGAVGLVGLVAITAGGAYVAWRQPPAASRSAIQHFAAGALFAGLVVEVFPTLIDRSELLLWTAIGLCAGTVALIGARIWSERSGSSSFALTLAIDVIIDGGLLGITISEGAKPSGLAILFTVALAPELFFLGISFIEKVRADDWGLMRSTGAAAALGTGVLAAAFLGLGLLAISKTVATAALAFGGAGIAYFVVEELIREAHEERMSPGYPALFFAAFLVLFIVGIGVS